MKLSKKKEDQLYELIHQEIMDARIQISLKLKDSSYNKQVQEGIDKVMYDLLNKTPEKAIKLFKENGN